MVVFFVGAYTTYDGILSTQQTKKSNQDVHGGNTLSNQDRSDYF